MRNPPAAPSVAAQLAVRGAGGAAVGLAFGAALLMLDVASLGSLVVASTDSATPIVFLFGAVIAFAPAAACASIGMLWVSGGAGTDSESAEPSINPRPGSSPSRTR